MLRDLIFFRFNTERIIEEKFYKFKTNLTSLITVFFILFQAFYYLIYYILSFNFEILFNKHYFILLANSLFLSFYLALNVFSKELTLKYFIFLSLLIEATALALLFEAREYFVVTMNMLFAFLLITQLDKRYLLYIIGLFVFFYVFENILACSQILYGKPIVGTLHNTGVFAIYLTIHIPLVLFSISECFKRIRNVNERFGHLFRLLIIGEIISCLISICIIILNQSRTSLIGLGSIILFYCFQNRSYLKQKIDVSYSAINTSLALSTVSIGFILYRYFFSIKKLSITGRLLMSKIALIHIGDNFWLGCGIGRFTWYYPQWQARYFGQTSNLPSDFRQSAGESYIAFNEFLQLFETIGLIGFILFLGILLLFFFAKSNQHRTFLQSIKLTVFTILMMGFTYYPFHINCILLLFSFCLAAIFNICDYFPQITCKAFDYKLIGYRRYLMLVVFSGICFTLIFKTFKADRAINIWQVMKTNIKSDNELSKEYKCIYPTLKGDDKFLCDYGEFLSTNIINSKFAIPILNKAKENYISRELMEAIGRAYWNVKDYKNAILYYKWVSNFLPNILEPKIDMLDLYIESGNIIEAKKIALEIEQFIPKIKSTQADLMKQQAQYILDNLNKLK